MSDVNVWTATGRVGSDPEFRDVGEHKVAKFSLAVDNYSGPGKPPRTTWMTCQLWGNRSKVAEFIRKGMALTVTGRIEINKDDKGRYWTTANLSDVKLPPKRESDSDAAGAQSRAREAAAPF